MSDKKYSKVSLISNLILFFVAASALILVIVKLYEASRIPPEELFGLYIGIMVIFAIVLSLYGALVFVNVIFGEIHAATGKWGFAIPCILLDVLILSVDGLLASVFVQDGSFLFVAICAAFALLSLVSLGANVLSVLKRGR